MPPLNVNLQQMIEQIDTDLTDGDDLAKVSEARQRSQTLTGIGDQLIDHFVTRARSSGASWSQIGDALGVSKQAAQQRWTPSTFERFTDRARRAVVLSEESARRLHHTSIRPEHVLLGLLAVEEGAASQVLVAMAGERAAMESRVTEALPAPSSEVSLAHIPFTPAAKEALKQSFIQAGQLHHNYIGTEHLLLGLLKTPDTQLAQLFSDLGVGYDETRTRVIEWIAARAAAHPEAAARMRGETDGTQSDPPAESSG